MSISRNSGTYIVHCQKDLGAKFLVKPTSCVQLFSCFLDQLIKMLEWLCAKNKYTCSWHKWQFCVLLASISELVWQETGQSCQLRVEMTLGLTGQTSKNLGSFWLWKKWGKLPTHIITMVLGRLYMSPELSLKVLYMQRNPWFGQVAHVAWPSLKHAVLATWPQDEAGVSRSMTLGT